MDSAQATGSVPAQPPAADTGAPAPGLIDNAAALWGDLKGLAHDHLELAALETRRAGESLVSIVAYGIVVGVLLVSAWLGLIAALVLWLVDRGVAASAAVLLAVLVNLVGAGVLVLLIKRTSQALKFPATVRALKPGGPPQPVETT